MTKPEVEVNDGGLPTVTKIREVAGLDKQDFKTVDEKVKHFVAEHEKTTAKTPRAWKNPVYRALADEFLVERGNGDHHFHGTRSSMPVDALVWPEDKDTITYIIFSWIKFNATKHHVNKRKAEQEAAGGTPTKKVKVSDKRTEEEEEEESVQGADGGKKGKDGAVEKDESIAVKRKNTPKKGPAKEDAAKTPKKVTKKSDGDDQEGSKKEKKSEEVVENDDDDEEDMQAVMRAKREAAKDKAKVDTTKPSSSTTLFNPDFGFSMPAGQPSTEVGSTGIVPDGAAATAQVPEVVVAAPKADEEELKDNHDDDNSNIAKSVKESGDHDASGDELMAKYVHIPEDEQEQIKKERTKSVSVRADTPAGRLDTPADTPMESTEHENSHDEGNKHDLIANANVTEDIKNYIPHTPVSHPGGLQTRLNTPVPASVTSLSGLKHATNITLDVSILASPNTTMTSAVSRLMVVPTHTSFAEILGKYVLQLPQGDLGYQALADAATCKVRVGGSAVGVAEQVFGMRDAHVERMWRAAIGKAVRGLRGEDEVVEVELY